MEELTIEEKAQRYDKAVEKIKYVMEHGVSPVLNKEDLQDIFPELKKSEDERIRKELIDFIFDKTDTYELREKSNSWLAWLEKQGEKKSIDNLTPQEAMDIAVAKCFDKQKSTDKVEPKFKVGDIVKDPYGDVYHIIEINNDSYKTDDGRFILFENEDVYRLQDVKDGDEIKPKFHEGEWIVQENIGVYKVIEVCESWYEVVDNKDKHYSIEFDKEYMCRLWSIQDAKDGDVLATLNQIEKILPEYGGVSHCHYDFGCSTPQFDFNKDDNWYFGKEAKVYPATKEQRDALMKAMADAGYTFDFEKKELKMIEQKPAWSEEDERIYQSIIDDTVQENQLNDEQTNWLKDIKYRYFPQPKQECSEEDSAMINKLLAVVDLYYNRSGDDLGKQSCISWLKSLRPQKKQGWSKRILI